MVLTPSPRKPEAKKAKATSKVEAKPAPKKAKVASKIKKGGKSKGKK